MSAAPLGWAPALQLTMLGLLAAYGLFVCAQRWVRAKRRRRNRLKYQQPISATVARAFCKAMSETYQSQAGDRKS